MAAARVMSPRTPLRRLLQPGDGDVWDVSTKVPTLLCGDFNSVQLPLAEGAGRRRRTRMFAAGKYAQSCRHY